MSETVPQPVSDQEQDWFDRPLLRFLILASIYLLGVTAVCVIQASHNALTVEWIPLIAFLLPLGLGFGIVESIPVHLLPYGTVRFVLGLVGAVIFLIPVVGIMVARRRWSLILCIVGLIIAVSLAVHGCAPVTPRSLFI